MKMPVNTFFNFSTTEMSAQSVKDWVDVGFNVATTYTYDPDKHTLKKLTDMLDKAKKEKIEMLVSDSRIGYKAFVSEGEEAFRKNATDALRDYGGHPAFMGFFLGDEPTAAYYDAVVRVNLILAEYSDKTNFVNFFPICGESTIGCKVSEYEDVLTDLIVRGKYRIWGMDHYGCMWVHERKRGMKDYFASLNICQRIAQKTNTSCWWAGVCFGHWNMAQPTFADFRWQQSIAFVHGTQGISWYKFYDRKTGCSSFAKGCESEFPVNFLGDRTAAFYHLRTITKLFYEKYAPKLVSLRHVKTWHTTEAFADTQVFCEGADEFLIKVESGHNIPAAVARFENIQTHRPSYILMNLSQQVPENYSYQFCGEHSQMSGSLWLCPGQMEIIDL